MSFYAQPFPNGVARNMRKALRYPAMQAFVPGGQRFTTLLDDEPVIEFYCEHPPRLKAEFEELVAFFMAVRGVDPFLFQDPSDHMATQANSSLTLISGSIYQMNRLYVSPGRTTVKPIYKPRAGAKIYRTRAAVVSDITGTSTVSTTTGQVEVTGHMSGDTYTWAGLFYLPMYFADPEAVFTVIGTSSMITEWSDITLRESREIA
ncbi:MAG: DUF2460 domain-containing protein [Hydrogenophaga sp.]|uniref:DUF2460 domain-containing protein n=1 Tax=Hydrogenophaga sp. TaxID=1904254 RepID=UPI0027324B99|nr:DUF2460 domain-containing protein [Hydrogenophaga sp.]MDP3625014.1 DUF2460 domain-containing protein [Hydrogenophaga sp.]